MREIFLGALAALFLFAGQAHAQDMGRFATAGDLDNTTDVSIRAAQPNLQHCVDGVVVSATATLGADTVVRLLSNDTVIWNCALDTGGLNGCKQDLVLPVCATTGEALEIDSSADVTDDLVIYSVQGFSRRIPNTAVITTP